MHQVKLTLNKAGNGSFLIKDGLQTTAEMVIHISGKELTVYHTEVFTDGEGKGLGKQLLEAMVAHSRKNGLKIIPLCPFVLLQFKRHPEDYKDVWSKVA